MGEAFWTILTDSFSHELSVLEIFSNYVINQCKVYVEVKKIKKTKPVRNHELFTC